MVVEKIGAERNAISKYWFPSQTKRSYLTGQYPPCQKKNTILIHLPPYKSTGWKRPSTWKERCTWPPNRATWYRRWYKMDRFVIRWRPRWLCWHLLQANSSFSKWLPKSAECCRATQRLRWRPRTSEPDRRCITPAPWGVGTRPRTSRWWRTWWGTRYPSERSFPRDRPPGWCTEKRVENSD